MKRFLKIYLDKPELAGLALLIVLVIVFQAKSNGILLSFENIRGVMGLLPEMALVAIGVTLLMICGEFDLSVGSVFALMPMSMAVILNSGVPFTAAVLLGLMICGAVGFINGYVTLQFSIPYVASKGAMLGLTKELARELGPHGVRVNAVSPGAVVSEPEERVFADRLQQYNDWILENQSLKARIQPRDVAELVHFLVSPASDMISGQNIAIDGGW